eukprot:gene5978-biopygen7499
MVTGPRAPAEPSRQKVKSASLRSSPRVSPGFLTHPPSRLGAAAAPAARDLVRDADPERRLAPRPLEAVEQVPEPGLRCPEIAGPPDSATLRYHSRFSNPASSQQIQQPCVITAEAERAARLLAQPRQLRGQRPGLVGDLVGDPVRRVGDERPLREQPLPLRDAVKAAGTRKPCQQDLEALSAGSGGLASRIWRPCQRRPSRS